MEYLFDKLNQLQGKLKRAHLMLFLDYDGTLAPIVDNPDIAVLSPEVKDILTRLKGLPNCEVVIISGRSLEDVKKRIGIEGITYVGNHGFEIDGPSIKFHNTLTEGTKKAFREIKKAMDRRFDSIRGVLVEDKKYSMAVHYRLTEQKDIPLLKRILDDILRIFVIRKSIKVKTGKKVVEVRPAANWDKGKVVLWLLARQRFASKDAETAVIYIGDDTTDEDAFRILKDEGITIFVGNPQPFSAKYYLRDNDEVAQFLRSLLALR